jgi:uncharacterized protein YoxC
MLFMVAAKRVAMERPDGMPPDAGEVLEAFKQSEAEIRQAAADVFTQEELAEIDQLIERWARDNPNQVYTARTKLADFARQRHASPTDPSNALPTSIFRFLYIDPLAGLDPVARELQQSRLFAERTSFLIQRMPGLLGWQAKLVAQESLALPEVSSLIQTTSSLAQTGEKLAGTADRFVDQTQQLNDRAQTLQAQVDEINLQTRDLLQQTQGFKDDFSTITQTLEKIPDLVRTERQAAIEQSLAGIDQQRQKLAADIAVREENLRALLDKADVSLKETRQSLASSVDNARNIVTDSKTVGVHLVDAIFYRALILLVVLLVGLPLGVILASRWRAKA